MTRLKVWGVNTSLRGVQARTLVAARSQKRAVELLAEVGSPVSLHYFREYGSQTWNHGELEIATEEGVWVNIGDYHEALFKRWPRKAKR